MSKPVLSNSICGYLTGDPTKPRSADFGQACRVDTENALWGFCPETVIQASDCGLAGACSDLYGCSSVCGLIDKTAITTFSWYENKPSDTLIRLVSSPANVVLLFRSTNPAGGFCSTALLTAGPDQTYSYLACGPADVTDHLLAFTTPASTTSTSQVSASSPASSLPTLTAASSLPSSTAASSLPIDNSPPSSISSSVPTLSPSKPSAVAATPSNTGPIVGGVIGGLAFVGFVVFAIYVLRRLKSLRASTTPGSPSIWRSERKNNGGARDRGSKLPPQQPEWANPIELNAERLPTEMPMGRHYEIPELYDHRSEAIQN